MNRLFLLGFILYSLFLVGLLTHAGELLAFMVPFLIYIGAATLYGPDRIRLKAQRTLSSDRVSQDMPVTVSLKITNEGSRLEEVFLEDQVPISLDLIDGAASLVTTLEPGESLNWEYTLRSKRGYYLFPGVGAWAIECCLSLLNQNAWSFARVEPRSTPGLFRLALAALELNFSGSGSISRVILLTPLIGRPRPVTPGLFSPMSSSRNGWPTWD